MIRRRTEHTPLTRRHPPRPPPIQPIPHNRTQHIQCIHVGTTPTRQSSTHKPHRPKLFQPSRVRRTQIHRNHRVNQNPYRLPVPRQTSLNPITIRSTISRHLIATRPNRVPTNGNDTTNKRILHNPNINISRRRTHIRVKHDQPTGHPRLKYLLTQLTPLTIITRHHSHTPTRINQRRPSQVTALRRSINIGGRSTPPPPNRDTNRGSFRMNHSQPPNIHKRHLSRPNITNHSVTSPHNIRHTQRIRQLKSTSRRIGITTKRHNRLLHRRPHVKRMVHITHSSRNTIQNLNRAQTRSHHRPDHAYYTHESSESYDPQPSTSPIHHEPNEQNHTNNQPHHQQ